MRKLVINTFVSLDGVMQAPGGPEEDTTGGFKYGGWTVHYWDDNQELNEFMSVPFELLLGRKTYEIFAAYWPFQKDEIAEKFNATKKYVVSKTLKTTDWQNSIIISGNVVDEISKLRKQDGSELHVYGSGNLIQTLLKYNLFDEIKVWTFPLILGKGKKLFEENDAAAFKLLDSKTSGTGVVINTYQPAGEIKIGTFEVQKPSEAEMVRRKKWAIEDQIS